MASSFNVEQPDVITKCPTPVELLVTAMGGHNGIGGAAISRHVEDCAACRRRVRETRALAAMLHSIPVATLSSNCLDDDAIAALADGGDLTVARDAMVHVSACANCRARLAAVARLTEDATVRSEINALQPPRRLTRQGWSRRQLTVSGGLAAAAAAAIVLLGPVRSRVSTDQTRANAGPHRELAITAATAPRIVSPIDIADLADSLRWTSVPRADLYRVRIWNNEGTVVWTTDTRGTSVALPQVVHPGTSYMWEVRARTGWDRWVSSDFVEFTIRARRAR
jgi:hypothetical protein